MPANNSVMCKKQWCLSAAMAGHEMCVVHARHPRFQPGDKSDASFEVEYYACPCCDSDGRCYAGEGHRTCSRCEQDCQTCDASGQCHRCEGEGVVTKEQLDQEHEQQRKFKKQIDETARQANARAARRAVTDIRVKAREKSARAGESPHGDEAT